MRVDGSLNTVREPHDGPELGLLGPILEVSDAVLCIEPVVVRDEWLGVAVERSIVCLLFTRQVFVLHLFETYYLAT